MVVILVFYTAYVAAQLVGAGTILEATFDIPKEYGLLIGALVVVFYTLMGGFLAVAWTDLIQGILMTAVAVLLPLVGIIYIGGPGVLAERLAERGPSFLEVSGGEVGHAFWFGVVVGGLSWGLGYLGQPHLLTRYMAIRKTAELRLGGMIAMGWTLLSYWGAPMIGIVAVAVLGPDLANPDQVMPLLAKALMPGWLAGLMIARRHGGHDVHRGQPAAGRELDARRGHLRPDVAPGRRPPAAGDDVAASDDRHRGGGLRSGLASALQRRLRRAVAD